MEERGKERERGREKREGRGDEQGIPISQLQRSRQLEIPCLAERKGKKEGNVVSSGATMPAVARRPSLVMCAEGGGEERRRGEKEGGTRRGAVAASSEKGGKREKLEIAVKHYVPRLELLWQPYQLLFHHRRKK